MLGKSIESLVFGDHDWDYYPENPAPIVNDEPMTEEELIALVAKLGQQETQKDTNNETKISGDAEKISLDLATIIENELARYGLCPK